MEKDYLRGFRKALIGGALGVVTMANSGCLNYSQINGSIRNGLNPSQEIQVRETIRPDSKKYLTLEEINKQYMQNEQSGKYGSFTPKQLDEERDRLLNQISPEDRESFLDCLGRAASAFSVN